MRGGLIYFLRKLYDNFPPTQRNVCKTTMYSNNFNTTPNVLRCSIINFSTIQLYICFKMFVTCMMRYIYVIYRPRGPDREILARGHENGSRP